MYASLNTGAIHVGMPTLERGLELARLGGFEGLEASAEMIADLVEAQGVAKARETFDRHGVRLSSFGLPVDWRAANWDEEGAVRVVRRAAAAAAALDCRRCLTWVMPGHDDLNADHYGEFLVERLGPLAAALREEGVGLGLEFIGPKTLRDTLRFPGPYTLRAMLRVAASLGPGNGVLLDAFHLFTSGGTLDDLRAVDPSRILGVHINDGRSGRSLDEQIDGERELPCATGVLDLAGFMTALREINYDGPVIAEPFLDSLKDLPDDEARVKRVGESVNAALALA